MPASYVLVGEAVHIRGYELLGYGKYLQISTARHVCLRQVASALYGDL